MRRLPLFLLFLLSFAFAEEFDHRALDAGGKPERIRLFLNEKWIAINHTPAVIDLKINEAENYIEVAALRKKGEGLIEIAPLGSSCSRFISFDIVDRAKPDAFRWVIGDIAKNAPPAITPPPYGAVAIEGETVSYSGEPRGGFFAVYATKEDALAKKQIAITARGLIALEAFLEVEEGGRIRAPFWSSFKFEPLIVLAPAKGEAFIDDKGLTFVASEGASGADRLIFIPFKDAEPISVPIVITRRSGAFIAAKSPSVKTIGGVSRTIRAAKDGGFNAE
ncbi:MAG: hypothetical protein LBC09_05685, partial [Helicobacteraceae bacterium]|nr:hypothetical protein [Helicobacteraceae bacterium]